MNSVHRIIESLLAQLHLIERDEPLVALIRVAQEDGEVKAWLTGLLALGDFDRKSAVNTLVESLRLQQAPEDFTEAVAALRDNEVARRAAELINKEQSRAGK